MGRTCLFLLALIPSLSFSHGGKDHSKEDIQKEEHVDGQNEFDKAVISRISESYQKTIFRATPALTPSSRSDYYLEMGNHD